jgi:hypothetical protein
MVFALFLVLVGLGVYSLIAEELPKTDESSNFSELASYKAVYNISLAGRHYNSPVSNVMGKMLYELEETCAGWILKQNMVTYLTDDAGNSFSTKSNYLIWESKAHDELEFHFRSFLGAIKTEEISGKATLSDALGYRVEFSMPYASEVELPKKTIFPIHHLMKITNHMKQGVMVTEDSVFDGSTYNNGFLINTTAFEKTNFKRTGHILNPLQKKQFSVLMSYYDPAGFAERSSYNVKIHMDESGVQHGLKVKYEDFSIKMELKKIEFLKAPKCNI